MLMRWVRCRLCLSVAAELAHTLGVVLLDTGHGLVKFHAEDLHLKGFDVGVHDVEDLVVGLVESLHCLGLGHLVHQCLHLADVCLGRGIAGACGARTGA